MPFILTVGEKKFYADDLTLAEARVCETEIGESWVLANPLRSAKWASSLLTRFHAREIGEDAAKELVDALTTRAALKLVDYAEDDDRPIEHQDAIPVVDPKAATAGSETTPS
ncbi:MAG TPA: hypothetical protein VN738_11285 [Acidothermaceae bacterium]|nr:hypothetical protein [Acidothermaceae bacterium]